MGNKVAGHFNVFVAKETVQGREKLQHNSSEFVDTDVFKTSMVDLASAQICTNAQTKSKGPISQCEICLHTVKTAHGFSYGRPSHIPIRRSCILKRPCTIQPRPVM